VCVGVGGGGGFTNVFTYSSYEPEKFMTIKVRVRVVVVVTCVPFSSVYPSDTSERRVTPRRPYPSDENQVTLGARRVGERCV